MNKKELDPEEMLQKFLYRVTIVAAPVVMFLVFVLASGVLA